MSCRTRRKGSCISSFRSSRYLRTNAETTVIDERKSVAIGTSIDDGAKFRRKQRTPRSSFHTIPWSPASTNSGLDHRHDPKPQKVDQIAITPTIWSISNLPNGREKEKKKFTLLVNFFLTSDFFNSLQKILPRWRIFCFLKAYFISLADIKVKTT